MADNLANATMNVSRMLRSVKELLAKADNPETIKAQICDDMKQALSKLRARFVAEGVNPDTSGDPYAVMFRNLESDFNKMKTSLRLI